MKEVFYFKKELMVPTYILWYATLIYLLKEMKSIDPITSAFKMLLIDFPITIALVLLIDDGLKDNSLPILNNFKAKNEAIDFKVKVFAQENKGAPATRNKGSKETTGEYIKFLDTDDYINSFKIKNQIDVLIKSKAKVVICDFCFVNEDGQILELIKNNENLRLKSAENRGVFTPIPIFHRSILEKGYFGMKD